MVRILIKLKGNQKYCVYTEPKWGIPNKLYAPYASVYMLALGVSDRQIGIVISIGMAFQMVFALLGGIITDKLGRKRTTFIFDLIGWSIPCIIWAIAKNFTYFAVAAVINSAWRVTGNSWMCLLVEDCDQDQLMSIFSWVNISGLLSAFFAPIAGLFVARYTLIPTVRALYIFSFIMMTLKFIILNIHAVETKQGMVRMKETKDESIFVMLGQYGSVLKSILRAPKTVLTLGIMAIMSISNMITGSFWSIIVTERLHIPAENIGIFSVIRSIVMLVLYFGLMPRINMLRFKKPMLIGFCIFIASQLILVTSPAGSYIVISASTILEALSLALINPMVDSMSVINVEPKERARIMAVLYVIVILVSSPFGWIAGTLSELNRTLPFIMNMVLFVIGIALTLPVSEAADRRELEA
jgi:MFS family permease